MFNPECDKCHFNRWTIQIRTDVGGDFVFMKCQMCGNTVGTNWVEFRTT